jgi:hypothetical protein
MPLGHDPLLLLLSALVLASAIAFALRIVDRDKW